VTARGDTKFKGPVKVRRNQTKIAVLGRAELQKCLVSRKIRAAPDIEDPGYSASERRFSDPTLDQAESSIEGSALEKILLVGLHRAVQKFASPHH
jgi:hypothetical protein